MAVPVATAAGSPLVSYVIKLPSVPGAIFASVIALSETVVDVLAVAALPVQLPELPLALPVTFPVTAPVMGPANPVAVKTPVPALYVIPASVFGAKSPVADSNKAGKQVVSVESATVISVGVVTAPPPYPYQ